MSQEELGKAIAKRLNRPIGVTYAQKKIAMFEAGAAAPTANELRAMAVELGVDQETLSSLIAPRAPHEAASVIDQLVTDTPGGRSLIATCLLSRVRPEPLDQNAMAMKQAIEEKGLSIAAFVPYPMTVHTATASDHINNLVGYYARVRKSVLEANLAFKNSLKKRSEAVALYFPRTEETISSVILIPPIFRQFSISFKQEKPPQGLITKSLNMWIPGSGTDASRPIKATGMYSVEEQVDAWESFFGSIPSHWTATGELCPSDPFWQKVT